MPHPKITVYRSAFSSGYRNSRIDKNDLYPSARYLMEGALYDSDDGLIEDSVRRSSKGDHVAHVAPSLFSHEQTCFEQVDGSTLFGGHFMAHYGHFITEGIGRLWLKDLSRFDHVAFFPFIFGADTNDFQDFHRTIFDKLGVGSEKIRILRKPTRFSELWVPSTLWSINEEASWYAKDLYSRISAKGMGNSNVRYFLSRHEHPRCKNVREIEDVFRNKGFSIVFPEDISFESQLSLYASAAAIAGFSGTLMHNVVFSSRENVVTIEVADVRSPRDFIPMQRAANNIAAVIPYLLTYRDLSTQVGLESLSVALDEILEQAMDGGML